MATLLFFLILLLLLVALLPIRVEINTEKQMYGQVVIWGICRISGEATGTGWYLHIQLPFFQKKINLLEGNALSAKKSSQPHVPKKPGLSMSSPLQLVKAFRLQTLVWSLDTGDYLHNARLYPVFGLLSRGPLQLSINFSGQNIFILKAYTSLYKLAAAFLKAHAFLTIYKKEH